MENAEKWGKRVDLNRLNKKIYAFLGAFPPAVGPIARYSLAHSSCSPAYSAICSEAGGE
jgi:hypothetical protein